MPGSASKPRDNSDGAFPLCPFTLASIVFVFFLLARIVDLRLKLPFLDRLPYEPKRCDEALDMEATSGFDYFAPKSSISSSAFDSTSASSIFDSPIDCFECVSLD